MDPLARAVVLNNTGAALLQEGGGGSGGNESAAASLAAFQRAMVLVRGAIVKSSNDDCGEVFRLYDGEGLQFQQLVQCDDAFGGSGGDFYVYIVPLRIPAALCSSRSHVSSSPLDDNNDSEAQTTHSMSAILLFNLALVHHRLGHQAIGRTQSSCLAHRKAAAGLYDALLDLLDHAECSRQVECGNFWLVLHCLALNNRSQLYYDDLDFVNSRRCLGIMKALLTQQQCNEDCRILEQHMDGHVAFEIYFNMLHPRGPPSTAPVA